VNLLADFLRPYCSDTSFSLAQVGKPPVLVSKGELAKINAERAVQRKAEMAVTKAAAEPVFNIDPTKVGRLETPAKAPAAAAAKPTHERFKKAHEVRWRLAPPEFRARESVVRNAWMQVAYRFSEGQFGSGT
jgi:hypothetical protein